MRNPYVEVSRTYIQRLLSSWIAILWTFVAFTMFLESLVISATPGRETTAMLGAMSDLFMAMLLWIHFREQVASDRKRLWPNYARPHVVVFIAISAVFFVGWPLMLIVLHGAPFIGLLAISTGIFALVGWCASTVSIVFGALAVMAELAMSVPEIGNAVFRERHEHLLIGIAVVSIVASALAVLRMLRSTGNDAGYGDGLQFDAWSYKPRMTGEINRAWSQQSGLFRPNSRIYIPTGVGLWERARRWRSLNRITVKPTLFLATLLFGVLWVAGGFERTGVKDLLIKPVSVWVVIMPPLLLPQSWLGFWRFLETDCLKPIDRGSFFQEIGLAIAVQALETWCIFAGLYILLIAWGNQWHLNVTQLAALLALSLGITACGLAAAFEFMRYRSPYIMIFSAIAMVPILGGVMAGTSVYFAWADSRPYMVIGAVVFIWLGVLVTRNAYRKWLVTELG